MAQKSVMLIGCIPIFVHSCEVYIYAILLLSYMLEGSFLTLVISVQLDR